MSGRQLAPENDERTILVEGLTDWEKERLNQLFYRYPELKRAWVLKESFRAWHREPDKSRAEEILELLGEKVASVASSTSLRSFYIKILKQDDLWLPQHG